MWFRSRRFSSLRRGCGDSGGTWRPSKRIGTCWRSIPSTPPPIRAWATRCFALNDSRRPWHRWHGRLGFSRSLPMAADRHAAMGRVYQELGRSEEAARQYERALTINPGNASARFLRRVAFRAAALREADEILIEVDEANARAHANMGATLYWLGRHDEALSRLCSFHGFRPCGNGLRRVARHIAARNTVACDYPLGCSRLGARRSLRHRRVLASGEAVACRIATMPSSSTQ